MKEQPEQDDLAKLASKFNLEVTAELNEVAMYCKKPEKFGFRGYPDPHAILTVFADIDMASTKDMALLKKKFQKAANSLGKAESYLAEIVEGIHEELYLIFGEAYRNRNEKRIGEEEVMGVEKLDELRDLLKDYEILLNESANLTDKYRVGGGSKRRDFFEMIIVLLCEVWSDQRSERPTQGWQFVDRNEPTTPFATFLKEFFALQFGDKSPKVRTHLGHALGIFSGMENGKENPLINKATDWR